MDSSQKPLKVSVLREEFVALTRDHLQAIVLNQLLYWSSRIRDFDHFIQEEQRRNPACNVSLRHGWIHKKARELIGETLLCISEGTMRRIIRTLVERGWVDERVNPEDPWDKSLQYRVNVGRIREALGKLGYGLPGFPLNEHGVCVPGGGVTEYGDELPELHNDGSFKEAEITPEITGKTTGANTGFAGSAQLSSVVCPEDLMATWCSVMGEQVVLTPCREKRLMAVFGDVFGHDMGAWKSFCLQVSRTPFLRGAGPRKWVASLDWCLSEGRAMRILEGCYSSWDSVTETEKTPSRVEDCLLEGNALEAELALEPGGQSRTFRMALLRHFGPVRFQRWFREAGVRSVSDGRLVLEAPNRFLAAMWQQRFHLELLKVGSAVFGTLDTLEAEPRE